MDCAGRHCFATCLDSRRQVACLLALLIASAFTAIAAGLNGTQTIEAMQQGMGSTLGYVATVVGLGALLGAILEATGGVLVISHALIKKFGEKKMPWALSFAGLIVSIPVFFDVAILLLVPFLFSLQKQTGRSLLYFAVPLLVGLGLGHALIPPTPGPIAAAQLLGADLGKVILSGIVVSLATIPVAGIWYGKYLSNRLFIGLPADYVEPETQLHGKMPSFGLVFFTLVLPVLLIVLNTFTQSGLLPMPARPKLFFGFIGHPFIALIIANLVAWYFLGIRYKLTRSKLLQVSARSLAPAGSIILLTGAGGVFKEVLIQTGAGTMLAGSLAAWGLPVLFFAFLVAALLRVVQGSATVAMITASGLVAPLLQNEFNDWQLAALVSAIACGATILSHVNDSGFWLIKQYLGLSEKQGFRTWTVASTIIAFVGFTVAAVIFYFAGRL